MFLIGSFLYLQVLIRALTRILKIGVRTLPSRKSWSFSIHFYWHFSKSWSQIQKVEVKNSIFGVNESSADDMHESLDEFGIWPDLTTD